MEFFQNVIQLYIERKDWFLELTGAHITLSLTAVLLAGITGLLLGIWIAECPKASGPVLTVANICYTIPSISLLGMLIPLLGIGNPTAVVALTLYGIMPMVRNTYAGITGVSSDIVSAAEAMGSTRVQIMLKIKLPLAMGVIVAGVRNMVVMTISVAAIASFIGAGGLGVAIYRGITIYDTAMTFSGSLLIALRRRTGYVIQNKGLFPHMTVEKNISYVPVISGRKNKEENRRKAIRLLKLVGLDESMADRYPSELSGGQQQRVGIARALAAEAKLLLMDEPFGALDEITKRALQDEMLALQEKLHMTVVFITHDIREAMKLGDRVLVMEQGRIAQLDTPEMIRRHPADAFVRELTASD